MAASKAKRSEAARKAARTRKRRAAAKAGITGKPIFTMTKYEKINRMTMPCGKNALLMVSMQRELEPQEILGDILKLIEKYGDKEYTPTLNYQLNF